MRYRVYRTIDKSPSLFGIEGSFFIIVGIFMGMGVLLAFTLGSLLGKMGGWVIFFLMSGAGYGITMLVQSKFSEKAFKRFVRKFFLPGFLRVFPSKLRCDDYSCFEGPVE